jgi:hypothetical protein
MDNAMAYSSSFVTDLVMTTKLKHPPVCDGFNCAIVPGGPSKWKQILLQSFYFGSFSVE